MQPEEILERLKSFALRSRTPTIDLAVFLRWMARDGPDPKDVEAGVRELSFRGAILLTTRGERPTSVTIPDFAVLLLEEEYRRISSDASLPFPRMDTLAIPIPKELALTMEAKEALGALLEHRADAEPAAVVLLFPENVPPMVVPSRCVGAELIEAAVARISHYLQDPRLASVMESRLRIALKGNEAPVRQALEDLVLRPRKAAATVMSPTELTLWFWSHLSNKVVADVGARPDRDEADQCLLQSAYLVSYTAFHQKAAAEREKERAVDRKSLEVLVRRPPYLFSAAAMFLFRDASGMLLAAKHGRQFIASFLQEAGAAADDEPLPFLVHLRSDRKDWFIQRDFVVPVFLREIDDAGEQLRLVYLREWVDAMRQDRPPGLCRNEALFRKDVEQRVRAQFPVILALSQPELLRLAAAVPAVPEDLVQDLERCFTRAGGVRPAYALLGLSRDRLYRQARSYLPFWQTMPVIRTVVRFLLRLFKRGTREGGSTLDSGPDPALGARGTQPAGPRPEAQVQAAPAAPDQAGGGRGGRSSTDSRREAERFRAAAWALVAKRVPLGSSPERTLEELADRWNPLVEPGPKQDLVNDVNALARDFLRPIRSSLLRHPPDEARITALAEQLAASRNLAGLGHREALLRYLSLYMLQVLVAL